MKILWVKAGGLVPPDTGGKIRSYNILRRLAQQHDVTLFLFYAKQENDQHPALRDAFHRVVCLPLEIPSTRSIEGLADYVRHFISGEPYNLSRYCRPIVRKELRTLLREEKYDVILCDFLVAAGVVPWEEKCPKVLFTHNVEAMIWKRHFDVAKNPFWKALSWREWKAMEAAEHKYLSLADHVLAVSETDRATFASFIDSGKLTVIPTGVDTAFFRPTQEPEIPNSMTFVGSMDWLPNEDAIIFFIEKIFLLIVREVPDATLTVIGRLPSNKLQALVARHPGISLTGRVEDVRPFLARGAVNIVPIRIGGGTRLKIFEAMSMGKAVVSTTIGAEGLPVTHGEHILLADDAAAFADSTVKLLRNPLERAKLGKAGRELVERDHSWTAVAAIFSKVLMNVSSS